MVPDQSPTFLHQSLDSLNVRVIFPNSNPQLTKLLEDITEPYELLSMVSRLPQVSCDVCHELAKLQDRGQQTNGRDGIEHGVFKLSDVSGISSGPSRKLAS